MHRQFLGTSSSSGGLIRCRGSNQVAGSQLLRSRSCSPRWSWSARWSTLDGRRPRDARRPDDPTGGTVAGHLSGARGQLAADLRRPAPRPPAGPGRGGRAAGPAAGWAASTATGAGDQGIALAGLWRCVRGGVDAAHPAGQGQPAGYLLEADLLEAARRPRVAADTIGACAQPPPLGAGRGRRRLPTCLVLPWAPGRAPRGSPGLTVLVGDLTVAAPARATPWWLLRVRRRAPADALVASCRGRPGRGRIVLLDLEAPGRDGDPEEGRPGPGALGDRGGDGAGPLATPCNVERGPDCSRTDSRCRLRLGRAGDGGRRGALGRWLGEAARHAPRGAGPGTAGQG